MRYENIRNMKVTLRKAFRRDRKVQGFDIIYVLFHLRDLPRDRSIKNQRASREDIRDL